MIVDEVDSMLIDDKASCTLLASEMPSMQKVVPLLVLMWDRLLSLREVKDDPNNDSNSDSQQEAEAAILIPADNEQ